jgi:hypothetical protein
MRASSTKKIRRTTWEEQMQRLEKIGSFAKLETLYRGKAKDKFYRWCLSQRRSANEMVKSDFEERYCRELNRRQRIGKELARARKSASSR